MRRNLVIIRTGDNPFHASWGSLANVSRSWDCFINTYGRRPQSASIGAELIFPQGITKFFGVADLLDQQPSLIDRYDAFLLLDDDIEVTPRQIERFFEIFHTAQLALAQPSLREDTFYNHFVTVKVPHALLRYTQFVEIMMPGFSRAALRRCLPSFRVAVSGWGLDYLWPELLGFPDRQIAIIDNVAVRHLNRSEPRGGPFYRFMRRLNVDAHGELQQIIRTHRVDTASRHVVRGTVPLKNWVTASASPGSAPGQTELPSGLSTIR